VPSYFYIRGKNSVTKVKTPSKRFLKSFRDKAMEMKMFDVDKGGQAIIIRNQEKAILYDAGVDKKNMIPGLVMKLYHYLKDNNVKLRALVASHNHIDHANVFAPLLEHPKVPNSEILRGDVEFFHQNIDRPTTEFYNTMIRVITTVTNIPDVPINAWDIEKISGWGVNQTITLFCGPDVAKKGDKRLYRSVLLRATIGKAKFLLTGDIASKPTEKKIIINKSTKKLLKKIDVLQITHHGSSDGTSHDFLTHVSPALFFTSSDQSDPNHDLSPQTEARIICYIEDKKDKFDTPHYTIFNTSWHGDIIIRTDGESRKIDGEEGVLFEVKLENPI